MTTRISLSSQSDVHLARVGDELSVELPEAPTGYRWTPVAHEHLRLVEDRMTVAPSAAPGDAAIHTLVFAVQEPGELLFRLEKRRPWEPERPSAAVEYRILAS